MLKYLNIDGSPPLNRRNYLEKKTIKPPTDYVTPCKSPSIIVIKNIIRNVNGQKQIT